MRGTGFTAAASICLAFFGGLWAATTANAAEPLVGEELALARPLAERQPGSFSSRLLTWPKDDEATTENGKSDEGDKKEGDKKEGGEEEKKEEPLESDRPDFTNTSTTVGYHKLQIEGGYTYTHAVDGDPTADRHDLPELLLRYGVAERLELRLAWDEGAVQPASGPGHRPRVIAKRQHRPHVRLEVRAHKTARLASPNRRDCRDHGPRRQPLAEQPAGGRQHRLPL